MPPAGFEPAISASKHSQTHTSDLVATRMGKVNNYNLQNLSAIINKRKFENICVT